MGEQAQERTRKKVFYSYWLPVLITDVRRNIGSLTGDT